MSFVDSPGLPLPWSKRTESPWAEPEMRARVSLRTKRGAPFYNRPTNRVLSSPFCLSMKRSPVTPRQARHPRRYAFHLVRRWMWVHSKLRRHACMSTTEASLDRHRYEPISRRGLLAICRTYISALYPLRRSIHLRGWHQEHMTSSRTKLYALITSVGLEVRRLAS